MAWSCASSSPRTAHPCLPEAYLFPQRIMGCKEGRSVNTVDGDHAGLDSIGFFRRTRPHTPRSM